MMSRPYKAKFRILLKDRYAQSVSFWGAKYRIVYSDGGEAPLITNKAASKDGYTVLIESKKPMKFRLELLNLSEGENIYEIPTYNVANSEVETTLNTNIRSVQVEKGFFQMKIEDPFGNKLDKNKFEYKIISKEKDKNGNLLILKDWSNLKEPGYTHILSIKKGLINFDSSIVDKFFKPFFNVMGVAASQAIFIIKNLGNHNGLFFIGAIRGRAYFHLAKFAKSSKDILIQRVPREHVFDFSPKGTVKGSLIGLIVGGGIELRNWLGQEKNQRDVTDLLGNLTGMAIKTIIGTWIGVILVSMIIGGGPIGVIIAVGLVVGIGVAWVLDALDEIFNITGSIRDLYNHLQSCTQNTIFEMVNNGNKLLGFNYTLPSWLF